MLSTAMQTNKPGPHWIGDRPYPPVLSLGAMLRRATTPRVQPFPQRWRERLLATVAADPQLVDEVLRLAEVH